jgi:hypothetical protein
MGTLSGEDAARFYTSIFTHSRTYFSICYTSMLPHAVCFSKLMQVMVRQFS